MLVHLAWGKGSALTPRHVSNSKGQRPLELDLPRLILHRWLGALPLALYAYTIRGQRPLIFYTCNITGQGPVMLSPKGLRPLCLKARALP